MNDDESKIEITEAEVDRLFARATQGRTVQHEVTIKQDSELLVRGSVMISAADDTVHCIATDPENNIIGAGTSCCVWHGLYKVMAAMALHVTNRQAKSAAERAIDKAQKGGIKIWAAVGTFVVHALLILVAALGGVPDALGHHQQPGRPTAQECHTDTECMALCDPEDADCDGGPEG